MSDSEYRTEADRLLALMRADAISYQEYSRRQSQLVNEFYSARLTKNCTCTGSCRGESGLGAGWRCVLSDKSKEPNHAA